MNETPVRGSRLLTAIGGAGFVEVLTLRGRNIVPMRVGCWLPGTCPVDDIRINDGRWTLRAGEVKLVAERRRFQ